MKDLKSVEEIGNNLRVILRIDSDLPIEEGQIVDNSRLKKSIPTIRLLLEKESKLIISSSLRLILDNNNFREISQKLFLT